MELPLPVVINILVADRHELIRIGLQALLGNHQSLRIIAEADSFTETLRLASQHNPDIILLDSPLNDGECLEHIPKLLTRCPQTKVLLFTGNTQEETHLHALRLGAAGIIGKHQSAELLLKSIRTVNAGQLWFDRNVTQLILQNQSSLNQKTDSVVNTLSSRERRVACLSSRGLSAKKIAAALAISEKTVRNQLTLIYEKLNVQGQVALCLQFNQLDFCDSPDLSCIQDKCPDKKG
ncbi:MAG: response regulator [Methylobacter sp.]